MYFDIFALIYNIYHILLVNSCGYYKFQAEIGVATNQDFYNEIAHKA